MTDSTTKLNKSTLYYPDRAPAQVTVEADLQSSPGEVWEALVEYPSWKNWFPNVKACFETTPLPKIPSNNKMYPLGSTRRIEISDLVADEEIIAFDEEQKVWAFTVFETNKPLAKYWVERVVLEPLYGDSEGTILVGTRARYAVGIEFLWYTRFVQPIVLRTIRNDWKQAFSQLDQYLLDRNQQQSSK
mmetsp:Transcript_4277/g.7860  ORF Transcript_4277/g.7860 Transcript_4277/m.7860 type:complete len:188 (+) Transcript_4277:75-638(+)